MQLKTEGALYIAVRSAHAGDFRQILKKKRQMNTPEMRSLLMRFHICIMEYVFSRHVNYLSALF